MATTKRKEKKNVFIPKCPTCSENLKFVKRFNENGSSMGMYFYCKCGFLEKHRKGAHKNFL